MIRQGEPKKEIGVSTGERQLTKQVHRAVTDRTAGERKERETLLQLKGLDGGMTTQQEADKYGKECKMR